MHEDAETAAVYLYLDTQKQACTNPSSALSFDCSDCALTTGAYSIQDIIYTNVADVLISVNPYKSIPLLYEVPLQQMQDGAGTGSEKSDEIFEVLTTRLRRHLD